jgi:hypothetical protein
MSKLNEYRKPTFFFPDLISAFSFSRVSLAALRSALLVFSTLGLWRAYIARDLVCFSPVPINAKYAATNGDVVQSSNGVASP